MALGLINGDGSALGLRLQGSDSAPVSSMTLALMQQQQSFCFVEIDQEPTPSLLRGFSAPILLDYAYTDAQLLALLLHDSDPFNRWEAGQRLGVNRAKQCIASGAPVALDDAYLNALRAVLRHDALDPAFKELTLTLPSEGYLAEQLAEVDPQRIHAVRAAMREQIAQALNADWQWAWETHRDSGAYSPDAVSAGRRALAGMALTNLCVAAVQTGDAVWPGKTLQCFKSAGNMTDRVNALGALLASGHALGGPALERFHALFRNDPLVLDKWFALQASAPDRGGNILPLVRKLMGHSDFHIQNPNRARSLIFSFCNANPAAFHRADAAGYVFWAERVLELDAINPQVAARLARAMDRWRKLAEPYRSGAREAIARVAAKPELSNDVREVVTRALEA